MAREAPGGKAQAREQISEPDIDITCMLNLIAWLASVIVV